MRDFLAALDGEAARRVGNPVNRRRDLESLHRGFTDARGKRAPDYLRTARVRKAYTASFLVPNAARAVHVLGRAGVGLGAGERALDAGAGLGASSLALAALSDADSEIVLVDMSGPALDDAASLFEKLFPAGPRVRTVRAELGGGDGGLPPGPFQTVLAGHLLNELLPRRGRDPGPALGLARALAGRVDRRGALAILEPAQRIPSRALSMIRGALIDDGLSPVFPCTHGRRCPVLAPGARDWCVTDVPWERTPLIAAVDRVLGTDRRRLTVSSLVMAREARPPGGRAHEVLSEAMPAGKDFVIYLCGERGRLAVRLPGRPSPPIPRGSIVDLPEKARPAGRDRSGAPLLPLPGLTPRGPDRR